MSVLSSEPLQLLFRRLATALGSNLLRRTPELSLPRMQEILRHAKARCYVGNGPIASVLE